MRMYENYKTFLAVTKILTLFLCACGVFFLGYDNGRNTIENMRPLMISHCAEKPDLCKEEYEHNKQWGKLREYQRPEIGDVK